MNVYNENGTAYRQAGSSTWYLVEKCGEEGNCRHRLANFSDLDAEEITDDHRQILLEAVEDGIFDEVCRGFLEHIRSKRFEKVNTYVARMVGL